MKNIIVQNKIDLEKSDKNNELEKEIAELINNKKNIETIKISTKDRSGIEELIIKINKAVNESKNELPMNIISESVDNKKKLVNSQGYLSFILIGDTEVGKTCFFNRYFRDTFSFDFLSTIGIEKESKLVKINNEVYKITLWDTAGQERFKSLPRKYYQNADGVFLLFDVNKEDTFNNVSNWINDMKENSNLVIGQEGNPQIPLFLLGNKIDSLERVISREQGKKLATSLGMKYFEISCKINMNIPEVMSQMIMESYMKTNHIDNCFRLSKGKNEKPEKKGVCC
jgi:small GTP-binding protein